MQCGSCGFENPPGMKFCGECGAAADTSCPSCSAPNPAGFKFCGGCGHALGKSGAPERAPNEYTPRHLADKILQSKSALEGERKRVTVLFADVKGSMKIAQRTDPERWHAILDRFFSILSDGVHRFEGTVNQYTGDGIMALFGAPIAHEDHAQRACFASLHLRDELKKYAEELRLSQGLDFSVRIGINSGDVVVGKIGDDLRMDYTAQGHTVGLAQRMEQVAAAHSICLSEDTAKLVGGYFAVRDLGQANIKDIDEPPDELSHQFLILDNDAIFSPRVASSIEGLGLVPRRTAFQSPWQNGTAERFVGSVRRELLDHVVVLGEDHLRRIPREYVDYYNAERIHTAIGDAPIGRESESRPSSRAQVIGLPRVGGLHHRYQWRDAA